MEPKPRGPLDNKEQEKIADLMGLPLVDGKPDTKTVQHMRAAGLLTDVEIDYSQQQREKKSETQ